MTRVALLTALFLGAATAASAQPSPLRLTVTDAIARSYETSQRLAEAEARQQGALATVEIRESASRPTAAASASYTRTNHVDEFGVLRPDGSRQIFYPDVPDNIVTRVSAQWPIYTAGRLDALERAARAEARATGADIDTARADLRFEVQRAYWAVATSHEAVRVLEESLARADAQVRDARQRLDVGLVPPSDVLTFEAQRAREELQLIEATNQREAALVDLRRLVGAAPDTPIELADGLTAAAAPSSTAVEPTALVAEALAGRPERQALTMRLEGAQARGEAAATGNKPTIALAGGADLARPNPKIFPREDIWQPSWDVGVNVTWTLFDGGRTRAEVAEAAAAARAVDARIKELDTIVDADVRQRLLDLRSMAASVRAADTGVRAAAEARRVLGERFAVGVATTTEVLVAQDQLLSAELARTRALANVRLAEARLERVLGRR